MYVFGQNLSIRLTLFIRGKNVVIVYDIFIFRCTFFFFVRCEGGGGGAGLFAPGFSPSYRAFVRSRFEV